MVIFSSYVKLPEGTHFDNQKKSGGHQSSPQCMLRVYESGADMKNHDFLRDELD
jgi:hypothetical protein